MKRNRWLFLLLLVLLARPESARALTLGQVDDFEDGTTQGWFVGLLGAPHPAPPANVPSGGPAGVLDNYLQLTSFGGAGAGSRLAAINASQWAGDYVAAGVHGIGMDLKNLGATDLALRLLVADPTVGPPDNIAVSTAAFLLPAGGDWTSVYFPLGVAELTALLGDTQTALTGATELRLFHADALGFPGEPIASQLGVDNIRALARPVPEPAAWILLGLGMSTLALRRRRN